MTKLAAICHDGYFMRKEAISRKAIPWMIGAGTIPLLAILGKITGTPPAITDLAGGGVGAALAHRAATHHAPIIINKGLQEGVKKIPIVRSIMKPKFLNRRLISTLSKKIPQEKLRAIAPWAGGAAALAGTAILSDLIDW